MIASEDLSSSLEKALGEGKVNIRGGWKTLWKKLRSEDLEGMKVKDLSKYSVNVFGNRVGIYSFGINRTPDLDSTAYAVNGLFHGAEFISGNPVLVSSGAREFLELVYQDERARLRKD